MIIIRQEHLYHGSHIQGIEALKAVSKMRGQDKRCVYLTDNIAYALFYIWDSRRNIKSGKHVTCGVVNGIVCYEEQFPNQLETFYSGVDGYLYAVKGQDNINIMRNSDGIWYSLDDLHIDESRYIPDVYQEILKYEKEGKIRIISYEQMPEDKIKMLNDHITRRILESRLLDNPQTADAIFYSKYFPKAWESAVIIKNNKV